MTSSYVRMDALRLPMAMSVPLVLRGRRAEQRGVVRGFRRGRLPARAGERAVYRIRRLAANRRQNGSFWSPQFFVMVPADPSGNLLLAALPQAEALWLPDL